LQTTSQDNRTTRQDVVAEIHPMPQDVQDDTNVDIPEVITSQDNTTTRQDPIPQDVQQDVNVEIAEVIISETHEVVIDNTNSHSNVCNKDEFSLPLTRYTT
jgi:hypothetical protein